MTFGRFEIDYSLPSCEFFSHYLQGVQHKFLGIPANFAHRKSHSLKAYQQGYFQ